MIILFCYFGLTNRTAAQSADTSSLTLDQCVAYALKHQPTINEAVLGVAIARSTNKITLASWLPQVNGTATFTHYTELPTSFFGPTPTKVGLVNTLIPGATLSQAIFSPVLFYAARSAPLLVKQAQEQVDSTHIDLVVGVTESFYNLLQTLEQIDVLKEDTARLGKNQRDTYHQYVGGVVDETDYDEAEIELNNSVQQLRQSQLNIVPLYATLKQAMGFPPDSNFNVNFDTAQMLHQVGFDTSADLQFDKRIEYQQLETAKRLQEQTIGYYRNAWLPSLSGEFVYNYEFENNSFGKLLSTTYPESYIGITLTIPIFTGFARIENVHKAKMQLEQLDWSEVGLKSEIYTQYATALANYKSDAINLDIQNRNTVLAKRTYNIVALQYNQGIVAYLNVITAESNLITSEIGYINAIFQLLTDKINLEKAMGYITY